MNSYLKLIITLISLNFARESIYKVNFLLRFSEGIIRVIMYTLFYVVIYQNTYIGVKGWSFNQMLILLGTFELIRAILFFLFISNLPKMEDHIHSGSLDTLLLYPTNTQFMLSLNTFSLVRIFDIIPALCLVIIGLYRSGISIQISAIIIYIVMIILGVILCYSIWFSIMCIAFRAERVSSLQEGFINLYEIARYPANVYPESIGRILTFIIPIIMSVTLPAQVFWGFDWKKAVTFFFLTVIWLVISRILFKRGLKIYRSSNG
ncbi:hypothetical protein COJ27_29850 [Bacillus cereus]|uniref:ABC transporter permease n=1 Tax=Bacillus cereus TaxID=1396 RepID=UPI000BF72273|nr:ABC-2 family transporter protein [Bacillus cereus]PFL57207.1 hypothetical protein COJ27_29850 [Bacillus cereus]